MENIFVEFLPPWIETGIQPAFYDKESGTVLQQTARMYARVNMLIRMFNKLSKNTKTTVEEYINQFNELHDYVHDYFDNLDVQEEINNKLDAMVEAGTLQEIITTYIQSNVAWTFDNVAEMKLATNLTDDSFTQTIGFYSANDMGGAMYKIREKTNEDVIDEMSLIGLYDNTLVAELIKTEEMNVKQFGAKGDGETDETTLLNQVFSWCNDKKVGKIIFPQGTYIITDSVTIYSNSIIEGCGKDNTIIKMNVSDDTETNHYILDFTNKSNLIIKNITFSGIKPLDDYTLIETKLYFGLRLNNSSKILIDNCGFQQLYSSALSIRDGSNITVSNSTFNHNGWNDIALTKTADDIKIVNNTFEDVVLRGINAEDGNMDELVTNILISGNKIDSKSTSTNLYAISFGNTSLSGDGHRYQNIIISDNEINRVWIGIAYKFAKNINITNNIITSGRGVSNNTNNMTDYNRDINISNNTFIPNHPYTGNKYAVELVKNYNLIFNGNTILDSTATAVTITQSNNITVNNNIIKNSGNNGLTLTNNTNVICNNNRIHDVSNNGVNLSSSNATFMNNEILNTGADAVTLGGQNSKFRIEGNYIFNATRYGILFPAGSSGSKFAVLRNNYFGEDRETPVFTYGYIANVDVDYVVIENTYIYTSGLNLRGSSHWGTNCTFRNNEGFGTLPS